MIIDDETLEKNGYTLEIGYEEDFIEDPRDWDNFGTMVCFHSRYNLGDNKNGLTTEQALELYNNKDNICLPLYLYDHSGLTISTSGDTYPYNDRWDAGQVGFIYVTKEQVRENWNIKKVTKKYRDMAIQVLKGEVKVYDYYLRGESYYYQVKDKDGEVVDSCSGYLGDLEYCRSEAVNSLDTFADSVA